MDTHTAESTADNMSSPVRKRPERCLSTNLTKAEHELRSHGKAVKRIALIPTDYYDCGHPGHLHRDSTTATICIKQGHNNPGPLPTTNAAGTLHWTKEMCLSLLAMTREPNVTMASIALTLSVSAGLIQQKVQTALRYEAKIEGARAEVHNVTFDYFTIRTRNCLLAADLTTVEAVRDAYRAKTLKDIPNMGRKSIAEVSDWLKRVES